MTLNCIYVIFSEIDLITLPKYGQICEPFLKCNVHARLEPSLVLNNVNDNLPMEKCFLNLRLFYVLTGLKGWGAVTRIFKKGEIKKFWTKGIRLIIMVI